MSARRELGGRTGATPPNRTTPKRLVGTGLAALFACLAAVGPSFAADWISAPAAAAADARKAPVALQFRRDLALNAVPRSLAVKVSADQRYVLYVNGRRVAAGPSRGDLAHWRVATIELAPYLRRGANVVAAEVWSEGRLAPLAQITSETTGFYVAAVDSSQAALIDSGPQWRVRVDESRTVQAGMPQLLKAVGPTYYVASNPETIDASRQAADWNRPETTAGGWSPPVAVAAEAGGRTLVADALPQMRYDQVSSGRLVRSSAVDAKGFPQRPVRIEANSEATLLVDAGRVLAAYPVLRTSQGAGAVVTLTYAEALYDPARPKGGENGSRGRFTDRARVADGQALGLTDTFKLDGVDRSLRPYWWRTWRFVEIKVKTGDRPLILRGLDTYETGYPFEARGRFVSDDAQLNKIWEIGWKTGLLDAHETYMDTAYWEQLQYIGDTRIQMLLSYDVSGDARLAVQALDAFDSSRRVNGLPQSAWPSRTNNSIPPFALLWIGALHDYWMRQPDTAVLTRNLDGVRAVLDWYAPYVRDSGLIAQTPGWPFIDWRPSLDGLRERAGRKGPDSCIIAMMYYGALRQAADLEGAVGEAERGASDRRQAERVKQGLTSQCWDAARGLYADTPEKTQFSQHANALAVIYDLVPVAEQAAVLDKVMVKGGGIGAPEGITGTTYYFSFYLAQALDHAGLADRYLDLMRTWRDLLGQNFTTWPENPDPSRSDTHAWSAHPTSGLLTYVAGVAPAAPGFAKVRIAPHLGRLRRLDAAMAHPKGLIETRYALDGDRLKATIKLPKGVEGEFIWRGQARPLRSGTNRIALFGRPSQGAEARAPSHAHSDHH
jgi:alpha-L-rhamnosidase